MKKGTVKWRNAEKIWSFNLLKGRIREKNTSYRKLSEGIGIAVNTLSDKINGFYAMSIPEAEAIALFLEISPKELDKYFFSPMMRNSSKTA